MPTPPAPNPALVTRDAARRLPRVALLLLCAAYVLPGLFGRDPWRGNDLPAFAQMLAIAEGRAPWLEPMLGGVATHAALLPHWIGALAIQAGWGWLDPALAARLPFAGLLVLTLVAVWYAAFHLACTEAAQPLPLAFGGEASRTDYARAMADGALLALIATLGLLQLGHETTPELAQLAAVASWQWALSASPGRGWPPRVALLVALPALAASGAPVVALALGVVALVQAVTARRAAALKAQPQPSEPAPRALWPWLLGALALAVAAARPTHSWAWRLADRWELGSLLKLWLWFLWPSWLLALWTLWRWRSHLRQWHLAVPLGVAAVALAACTGMGGSAQALMLGLPGMAVLAAFALPTLQRTSTAAMDWFSLFFFTGVALTVWVFHLGMLIGTPAAALAAVDRLTPGFQPRWQWLELALAPAGTLAWAWLVRWRSGRHRPVIWKSLVLPAGGVALGWLLLMTLWLPWLDYARSNRPLAERLLPHLPPAGQCVAAPQGADTLVGALEWHARRRVDARPQALQGPCPVLVLSQRIEDPKHPPGPAWQRALDAGWVEVARVRRPTDRGEWTMVFRRKTPA